MKYLIWSGHIAQRKFYLRVGGLVKDRVWDVNFPLLRPISRTVNQGWSRYWEVVNS